MMLISLKHWQVFSETHHCCSNRNQTPVRPAFAWQLTSSSCRLLWKPLRRQGPQSSCVSMTCDGPWYVHDFVQQASEVVTVTWRGHRPCQSMTPCTNTQHWQSAPNHFQISTDCCFEETTHNNEPIFVCDAQLSTCPPRWAPMPTTLVPCSGALPC